MKLTLLLIFVAFVVMYVVLTKPATMSLISQPLPSPTSTPLQLSVDPVLFEYEGKTYAADIYESQTTTTYELIANYDQQETVQLVASASECTGAINAGFYHPDHRPLGWVKIQESELSIPTETSLFNAFANIDGDTITIDTQPSETAIYGFQAGPLLLASSEPRTLRLATDEPARRSVLATKINGAELFISIYAEGQLFDGPLLEDLPHVVSALSNAQSLQIATAMNLDGGSASAFYTPEKSVGELKPVGAILCAR